MLKGLNGLIAAAVLLTCACANSTGSAAPPGGGLNPARLRSGLSGHELGPGPRAAWITSREQFAAIVAKLGRYSAKAGTEAFPEIDFQRSGVLVVWMGQKPTGGFSLDLLPEKSYIRDRTAVVAVRWVEPAKGMMVPQIITHPFLMIRMDKGDYRRIAVVDQQGRSRAELDLP